MLETSPQVEPMTDEDYFALRRVCKPGFHEDRETFDVFKAEEKRRRALHLGWKCPEEVESNREKKAAKKADKADKLLYAKQMMNENNHLRSMGNQLVDALKKCRAAFNDYDPQFQEATKAIGRWEKKSGPGQFNADED